jgi:F-type H+-transporting ATPase subunit delta
VRSPWNIDLLARAGLTSYSSVSGGFAIVQPNSQLSINAVEGFPIEDFSEEAVKSQLSESQKIASGSGSEQDIAEAKIEVEVSRTTHSFRPWSDLVQVLESLQAALK